MSRRRVPEACLATLLIAGGLLTAAGPAAAASPGARSVGDSLYPTLGNGGYDAQSYDFALTFGQTPTSPVTGTITMKAKATQSLSSFSLDLGPKPWVQSVLVNGKPAPARRTDEKLIVTPKTPIPAGSTFTFATVGYRVRPSTIDDDPGSVAFYGGPSGTATAGQAAYEHLAFPVNDHPQDKATYTFELTAPKDQTAVANGKLTGTKTTGGVKTWSYALRQPMASELIQLAVGKYDLIDRGTHAGVTLRDVVVKGQRAAYEDAMKETPSMLDWLTSKLGPYPFETYGILISDQEIGFALETQTLSLFDTTWFTDYPEGVWAPTMLHELTHQWYGDSVSPKDWADIWINEGHASWYEFTYAAEHGFLGDDAGFDTIDELAQRVYALGDQWRQKYGVVGHPLSGSDDDLFSPQSYYGGFLVLYALKEKIGATAFAKLEKLYVTRYAGQTRGTADFIALASEVAGKDVGPFLRDWIYSAKTPAMPGHPDWTVEPLTPAATTRIAAVGADLPVFKRR